MSAPVLKPEFDTIIDRAIARHESSGDALIEILHLSQQLYGYLSRPVLKNVAHKLRLPPSKVLGVATFYHLFRVKPPCAHSATVCMGTACYAAGGPELLTTLRASRSPDWSIEQGRCLGSCGLAPVIVCDGEPLSRVTADVIQARLKEKS